MSLLDTTLHIPAEPAVFAPSRARFQRLILPLAARPAPRFYGALALAGFAALACLCMATELGTSAATGDAGRLLAVAFLVAAGIPGGIATAGLVDALRPAPHLLIDAGGFRDRRLGPERIDWSDVSAAELITAPSGICAIRLTLRKAGPLRFNPFRMGGWGARWRERHRVRICALTLLDQRAHALGHTMLILAGRHGATVASGS